LKEEPEETEMKFGVKIGSENFNESDTKTEISIDIGLSSNPQFAHVQSCS